MNKMYGLLVSLIAGLSTLIGYLFIYIKGDINKIISRSLAFASGVMISLSIIDLFPSALENLNKVYNYKITIIVSFIGFFFGYFISYVISKRIKNENNKLYKTGIITMLGIMLHNIPEGIVTFMLSTIDLKLGILFSIAIIMHNIPEGISISIPIYFSTKNRFKAFIYTFISGISELIGSILALLFLYKYMDSTIIGILFSIISGLMIYIGYYELFKTSYYYNNKKNTYMYTIIGILFIIVIEILLDI